MRVGFVMEQVLGHVSHYQTLRRVMAAGSSIEANWIEVTYAGDGRIEKYLPRKLSGVARGYQQVRAGLRGQRFDALFFHTQKPAVFQWDLLARIPTVLSLDVTPVQYDALGEYYDHAPDGDNAIARLKHAINKRTFGLARNIVVWSNWNKDSLVQDYDVPADKVRVIPPGVDLRFWEVARDETHAAGRLPRVLFVGGDFERKGGHLLVDWFRTYGRGRCELDLVTRSQIEPELGVTIHRNIGGNTPEARQLFSSADVFALPSLGECFGIASVEAMAAGLPVVATRVGGAADIVAHGESGFLIRPNDRRELGQALDQFLSDAELRRTMGRRGRARAKRLFDGAANARAIVSCIQDAAFATGSANISRAPASARR